MNEGINGQNILLILHRENSKLTCKELSINLCQSYAVGHDSTIVVQHGLRTTLAELEEILIRKRLERANEILLYSERICIEVENHCRIR